MHAGNESNAKVFIWLNRTQDVIESTAKRFYTDTTEYEQVLHLTGFVALVLSQTIVI